MNTNNGVKWWRFIVPKKVEQINDHLLVRFVANRARVLRSFEIY